VLGPPIERGLAAIGTVVAPNCNRRCVSAALIKGQQLWLPCWHCACAVLHFATDHVFTPATLKAGLALGSAGCWLSLHSSMPPARSSLCLGAS